jgi:hypothetical protein
MMPLLITVASLSLVAVVLLLLILFRKPELAFTDRVRTEVDRLSETLREELRTRVKKTRTRPAIARGTHDRPPRVGRFAG